MLKELYNIFNEYNKLIKYNIKLYNLVFAIRIKFKKKKYLINSIYDS